MHETNRPLRIEWHSSKIYQDRPVEKKTCERLNQCSDDEEGANQRICRPIESFSVPVNFWIIGGDMGDLRGRPLGPTFFLLHFSKLTKMGSKRLSMSVEITIEIWKTEKCPRGPKGKNGTARPSS
ncbi:Hypothetical protein NTJ_16042 [Nesidiocoris tenuis]|uniref:Uncharacterized protein n=1 Tax=Nesidiocoris tenuis TaxID=355587 RepID=A0ABN7BIQ9_9HEMI|nr:Hypothetical protein NTJ_16042 [Nesidiocoris tenuis]